MRTKSVKMHTLIWAFLVTALHAVQSCHHHCPAEEECPFGRRFTGSGCGGCECLPDQCSVLPPCCGRFSVATPESESLVSVDDPQVVLDGKPPRCGFFKHCVLVDNDECNDSTAPCNTRIPRCQTCPFFSCTLICEKTGFKRDDQDCPYCECNPVCDPIPPCDNVCPYGFEEDDNGCPSCECVDPCANVECPTNHYCTVVEDPCLATALKPCTPAVQCVPCVPIGHCEIWCPFGIRVDEHGCEECACIDPPTCEDHECPSGEKCVAVDVKCDYPPCQPPYVLECVPCEPVLCKIHCPNGFKVDKDGCEYCECNP